MCLSFGKWEKGDCASEARRRTGSIPRPCAQTGQLYKRALVEVEDSSCEAPKMTYTKGRTLWSVFMYSQEHLYLSLCWSIAGWMSKEREGDGARGPFPEG